MIQKVACVHERHNLHVNVSLCHTAIYTQRGARGRGEHLLDRSTFVMSTERAHGPSGVLLERAFSTEHGLRFLLVASPMSLSSPQKSK